MANFNITKEITKEFEGGFWNDPSAGWTYRGITEKNYPSWPGFARIRQLTGGRAPARYAVIKDSILDTMVDDFYNAAFWKKIVSGDSIRSQEVANMAYDFILHKQNAAVAVINNVAKTFSPAAATKLTVLSADVLRAMNTSPAAFYSRLRAARIAYYNNSPKFSKPMKAAFVKRVNKMPEKISTPGKLPDMLNTFLLFSV